METPASASVGKDKATLESTIERLSSVLKNEALRAETPLEVQNAIELAVEAIRTTIQDACSPAVRVSPPRSHGMPTRQQGQFLAYIREYMAHNYQGVAPAHADFQKFFNLTPPSVNCKR